MSALRIPLVLAVAVLMPLSAKAQGQPADLLPNPSFEQGRHQPEGWSLSSAGGGGWVADGRAGERCVSVTGSGDDSTWWAAPAGAVEGGRLYRVSYWVRRAEGGGGVEIAGLNRVNRDTAAGREWGHQEFFFRAPHGLEASFFRLGQWHVNGTSHFDEASLVPALVIHSRRNALDVPLGAGETISSGRYVARHPLGDRGSTDFRCLDHFTADFNSDRWVFSGADEVAYHHSLRRLGQAESEVEVGVNWYERGTLVVEAGTDGEQWVRLGEVGEVERVAFPLPSGLLPSQDVYVRLRTAGDASLQVDHYQYQCVLPGARDLASAAGASHYLGLRYRPSDLEVEVEDLGRLLPGGADEAVLTIVNRGPRRSLSLAINIEREGRTIWTQEKAVAIGPGKRERVRLGYELDHPGDYTIRLTCSEPDVAAPLWQAEGGFMVSPLHDSGGELLAEGADVAIWWCEPERKVSQVRPVPRAMGKAMRISAAGGEYEAAQLVLSPAADLQDCRLTVGELISESGGRIAASEIEIRSVEYVFVAQPTDEVGAVDAWPDPLPLHRTPVGLAGARNHPFWITVHVPAGTPAGDYRGEITLAARGLSRSVPLHVHVWGFDLPRETHVRSGFGLSRGLMERYHNLETEEEVGEVLDLYLRSFASHRVSPYSVGAGIGVTWHELPSGDTEPELDFSGFDAAAHHALDELGFNGFVLGLEGLGGGTFHSRYLGEIAGHKQGSPEHEAAFTKYAKAVAEHLDAKGWLDKAYVYWFDEPEAKDFDFVHEGMELIGRAAPRLTRMLTTHPNPDLYGAVDLWCLPTYTLDPEVVRQRQEVGEEIWWYLCTGPKAPYFTLFLDHYGTEMRLWLWETWKYGLSGILVWQANYWTSGSAYPRPELQNPWQDPMSWTSGYDTPAGARQPWGNGDGRFLYPPNRDPEADTAKYVEGPVPSIRWELLRDGIEDYEYFWLLRQEVRRLKEAGAEPEAYLDAGKLLEVPADVCVDLTHFTVRPEPIHAHRAKLAQAIERLRAR